MPPVAQPCLEASAVLGRGAEVWREGGDDLLARAGADFHLGPVLRDAQANLGQVENLAAFVAHEGLPAEVFAAAAGAALEAMGDAPVRPQDWLEGVSRVAVLSPRLAAGPLAETFGARLGVAVGRRRTVAVGAVLSQAGFQGLEHALEVEDQIDEAAGLASGQGFEVPTGPAGGAFHGNPGPGDRDGRP